MKRVLTIMTVLLLTAPAVSQPALMKGTENKHFSPEEMSQARYVGSTAGGEAWIMEGKKHVKEVVVTDINLNVVTTVTLPGTASEQAEVMAASCDEDGVGVLVAQRGNKRTVLLCYSFGMPNPTVQMDTLTVFDYGRKDVCMLWSATSPKGERNALVAVVQLTDTKQFYTFTTVMDVLMRPMWSRSSDLGSLHDVVVTDDGRVVTLGEERDMVLRKNDDRGEWHFIYNVLDSTSAATYDAVVKCNPLEKIHLAAVVGHHAVSVGTYHPSSGRNTDKMTGGVLAMSFDLDAATMTGVTMRPFQNEDMNVFMNEKTKKMQKSQECDHVKVLGVTATHYGAAIALGHDMEVEKTSGGAVEREGYGMGLSVVAVDTLGQVHWVRNIRRNDVCEGGGLPTVGFATVGEKVCVVKTEHPKMPMVYEISDGAKRFKQGDAGNMMIYMIDEDGATEKLMLEKKTKLTVDRAICQPSNSLLMVSHVGKKSRLSKLTF